MAETGTVNPRQETAPVEQDGSVEAASQALLAIEEKGDDQYESQRPEPKEGKAEAKAEADEEVEVEAEADEEVEDEDQLDTPVYTVKVEGKDTDVTLDELKSGYLKDSDYRKKTSELAEQRRGIDAQAQAIQAERNQYAQALGQMQSEATRQLGQYKQIDWDRLREEDPMLFMQRRDEQRELEKGIEDNQKQYQQLAVQAQAHQVQRFNQDVESGKAKLIERMPDWDDATSKEVRSFGLDEGFTNEELSTLTDPRSMVVLRKAMLYDRIHKSQPAKKKVKADTPRYVRPGVTKSKGEVSAKKRTEKLKQLRKSGKVDDAASMIYDLL